MLDITLIQTALHWENRGKNLSLFSELTDQVQQTDILILPEMFTTGFSMKPETFAETMDGEALAWMTSTSRKKNAVVTGSLMMNTGNGYTNRLIWASPDGSVKYYDKRHLFRMGDEQQHYLAGSDRILFEYKGYRIFPAVCYDLRFPVWLRRNKKFDYDLMVLVANWPERRNMHWKALIQARAIENQCWVAAVNRIGEDGNRVSHSGDSSLISPKGEILFTDANNPVVKTVRINRAEQESYRNSFPVIEDADEFTLL